MEGDDDLIVVRHQRDEFHSENVLVKKRSEFYRLGYLDLKTKCAHLEKRLQNQGALRAKQEKLHNETIQDMEFQLKNAMDVITSLKDLLATSQKDRLHLLEQHNERMIENQILKEKLFRTGSFYDQCLEELDKQIQQNVHLREVNAKFIAELKNRDKE